jgi:hypothetical protein
VIPFGCTGGIGCTGRPAVGLLDRVWVGVGGSVVATTLGVGTDVPATGSGPGDRRLQAARQSSTNSPTRPYAGHLGRSDRAVTPRAYVDVEDSAEPPPMRDS